MEELELYKLIFYTYITPNNETDKIFLDSFALCSYHGIPLSTKECDIPRCIGKSNYIANISAQLNKTEDVLVITRNLCSAKHIREIAKDETLTILAENNIDERLRAYNPVKVFVDEISYSSYLKLLKYMHPKTIITGITII